MSLLREGRPVHSARPGPIRGLTLAMQELTETSGPGHDGIVMRFVVSVDVDTLRATQSDVDGS